MINCLCSAVPSNFTMLFSATQYNIVIESYQPLPPNTHLFDIILYINNNTLTDSFPGNTVFFSIDYGLAFGFEGVGPSTESFISDPAVFNTIELSVVTSSEFHFGLYYSTTITAVVVPALGIPPLFVNVSVNVTQTVYYNCTGDECFNEGICMPVDKNNFSCNCTEAFYGNKCERIIGEM